MTKTLQPVILDLTLHDAQMQVWESDARFKVVACGRRWGKTFLAVNELIAAAGSKPGSINWWIAPVYDQTDVALRFFTEALPPELIDLNRTKKVARLWNGSIVAFKTASDPDALRSEGLDFVVLDEAAFQKEDVWPSAIRPALADKKGRALLIGTFDGENWFYDMYQRGQSEEYEEWESWRFPSSANPFLDPEEIEEARRGTPKAEFEQEWMANPLAYVGSVFPGEKVQAAVERGQDQDSDHEEAEVFAGLDWGYTNATAFEVCREYPASGRVRWFDERLWVATQLETRVARIVELCGEHGIEEIYADAAGASENAALSAALDDAGLPTGLIRVGFGTKLKSGETAKDAGIKTRRWYLEQGLEDLSPDCPELIRTTKRYRYKENSEDVLKEDDHPVDAATAFYASRRGMLVEDKNKRSA